GGSSFDAQAPSLHPALDRGREKNSKRADNRKLETRRPFRKRRRVPVSDRLPAASVAASARRKKSGGHGGRRSLYLADGRDGVPRSATPIRDFRPPACRARSRPRTSPSVPRSGSAFRPARRR